MYRNELNKIGINVTKNDGRQKVVCPKCNGGSKSEKSLYVYIEDGGFKCHRATCGFKGHVRNFDKGKKYSRPQLKNQTQLPTKIVKWFESRGISQKTLQHFKITVSERGAIEFNYFRNEMLINVKTRYEKNGSKQFIQHKDSEKILYNLDSLKGVKKAIFVEGEMDVLSWHQIGLKDVGIISIDQGAAAVGQSLGAKLDCLKNCAEQLDHIEDFYLCLDKDAPGQHTQTELIKRLGDYRCNIIPLPEGFKDANEVLDSAKNGNYDISIRIEALKNCFKSSQPVPVEGIQLLDDDTWDAMSDYYENGYPKGRSTHFTNLDGVFSYLKGDISLITGIPSHGKGQMTKQLMVNMSYFNGWKWACYVPEDMPAYVFFDELCHTYAGQTPIKGYTNQMSPEKYNESRNWVKNHFFIITPPPMTKGGKITLPTNEWINKKINFLRLKYGVNAYIKDPWNKIFHQFQQREDQYLAMELSKEKFFAAQYDACFYIAHPKTMQKNKSDGSYSPPTAYDISGGAMFYNMFDNIACIHRPHIHENSNDKSVLFWQQKVKKQKLVGRPNKVNFWFDVAKNRYYEHATDRNPLENLPMGVSQDAPDTIEEDIPF